MKINETETFARTSFKDVVRYKVKWLISLIWRLYNKYIELYDFGDFFKKEDFSMVVEVDDHYRYIKSSFRNHKICTLIDEDTNEFFGWVELLESDNVKGVIPSIDTEIKVNLKLKSIIFKMKDKKYYNYPFYENKCQDIVTQLCTRVN